VLPTLLFCKVPLVKRKKCELPSRIFQMSLSESILSFWGIMCCSVMADKIRERKNHENGGFSYKNRKRLSVSNSFFKFYKRY
jgi:hypothetical protein